MPSELQTCKTFFLVSAIVNILILLGWSGTAVLSGLVTCGIGCFLGIIPLINLASCIMDFIAYNKLNNLSSFDTYKTMQFAAIMEIITILSSNVVSMIFGIITLNYINNENVVKFLKEKGIY
jgi:hypothetical protein